MSKPTVGWIGLGAMGSGMAKVRPLTRPWNQRALELTGQSLVQQGFPVQVYDVWAPSVEAAVAAGAKAAPTPADAARGAKVIGLMVVNAVQVEDVLFGAGEVASSKSASLFTATRLASLVPP